MSKQPKQSGNWSPLKIVGIIVALAGAIIAAYSAYSMVSFQPGAGFARHYYNESGGAYPGANAYNQSHFNYTRQGTLMAGFQDGVGPYRIAIGILMLLLGIATYKYAELKLTLRKGMRR